MKKFTVLVLKSILSVFVFTLFFTSCITDSSVSQGDFYRSRVVNKKDNRDYAMPAIHRPSGHGIFKKSNRVEDTESILSDKQTVPSPGLDIVVETTPAPATDMASVNSKLIADSGHDRLIKKINNLYTSSTDVKSFRKDYKEVKREQATQLFKTSRSDDPLGRATNSDNRPGMSIASFVLSIVGLFVAGLICGTLAIVFGVIGMKRGLKGLAIAGIIIGVIDIIAALIIISSM